MRSVSARSRIVNLSLLDAKRPFQIAMKRDIIDAGSGLPAETIVVPGCRKGTSMSLIGSQSLRVQINMADSTRTRLSQFSICRTRIRLDSHESPTQVRLAAIFIGHKMS
jgi:hypothetical protein